MKAHKAYLYNYKYVTILVFKEVYEAKPAYSGFVYNGIDTIRLFNSIPRKEAKKICKRFNKYMAKREKLGDTWFGGLIEIKEIINKFYSEVYHAI
jgi:hypothetical protein